MRSSHVLSTTQQRVKDKLFSFLLFKCFGSTSLDKTASETLKMTKPVVSSREPKISVNETARKYFKTTRANFKGEKNSDRKLFLN